MLRLVLVRLKNSLKSLQYASFEHISGGSMPTFFMKAILKCDPDQLSKLRFILADERYVPEHHSDSNYGAYHKLLDGSPLQESQFFRIEMCHSCEPSMFLTSCFFDPAI